MLRGGADLLAESRLSNVQRLRQAGIDGEIMLLRSPHPGQAEAAVQLTDVSLNSEVDTVQALSQAAVRLGRVHQVILMVEVGDRREGVMPADALEAARRILSMPGIDLVGLGGNVSCIGGVLPTRDNTELLVEVAEEVERALGMQFRVISGGHTASLALMDREEMPARVNQLRIGEGILLGVDSADCWPIPSPFQDVFRVVATVIEVKDKPSLPEGPITIDAFGRTPEWQDLGVRRRAILAMGEQDLRISGLTPLRPGVTVVSGSSDHVVLDVTDADPPVQVGEELFFDPNYAAVATAMASFDVDKVIKS
jgi:predicted amino acid racemase